MVVGGTPGRDVSSCNRVGIGTDRVSDANLHGANDGTSVRDGRAGFRWWREQAGRSGSVASSRSVMVTAYCSPMIETRVQCAIDAPIEDVFDRLVDLPSWSAWLDGECGSLGSRYTSPGPTGLGSTYEDSIRNGWVVPGELVEYDAPNRVTFLNRVSVDGELGLETRLAYVLRSLSPCTTSVEHHFRAEFSGPLADMEEALAGAMPAERRRISESLRCSFVGRH